MNDDDAIDRSEVILAVRDNSSGNINCLEVLEVTWLHALAAPWKKPTVHREAGLGSEASVERAGLEGDSCGRAMATAMASGGSIAIDQMENGE